MTKEKYMALADFQTLWTNSIKPYIVGGFIAITAVAEGATAKLVLQDGTLIAQSTFQAAGNYITAVSSTASGHDNLLLADGTNIAQATFIAATEKGANSGVATLGADGKVPSSQLPSYVDDVLEYANLAAFPASGEAGKIYTALDTNKTYRWGGTAYVEIAAGLALGETQGTAYEGSKGAANASAITALQSDKANKSEMAIADVSGDSTKKTITLKTGTSQDVIVAHQDISGKANAATTLAGYGITDAKIEGGVITLGSETITPLTSHQDISGKQDKITATGILKGEGNGTVSAAVAGTDYQAPLTAGTDYQTPLVAGTDYQTPLVAGTDYQTPIVFNTAYNASTNKAATMSDLPEVPERVSSSDLADFVV